jgi:pimeloyl-ACP methyl ester carboxylesterase
MDGKKLNKQSPNERRRVATRFGDVAYLEAGHGPPAVFVHGVFLNADLWRLQLEGLADLRRCLAVDLLAHGDSAPGDVGLTISDQVEMVVEFLDVLGIPSVDLVGNDSGGAIAQLIAARSPARVRTLTLTNCDTHDNWPPVAFAPIVSLAREGGLPDALRLLAADPEAALGALATGFEDPDDLADEVVTGFFGCFARSDAHAAAVQGYVAGMDCEVTVAIRDDLARFRSPTLIVWGTGDEFFDVAWSRWLATTIPGTVRRVEIEGAKLFFPMERPSEFNREIRRLWSGSGVGPGSAPARPA